MNAVQQFVRILRKYLSRRDGRKYRALRVRLGTEPLESRDVPAALGIRSIDGSGNNLANPTWGQAGSEFLRLAPAQYADGLSAPAGNARPNARAISNALADQSGEDIISDRMLSAMIYAWGQFIDHDLDLTKSGTEAFNIPVPTGDPDLDPNGTGTAVIGLNRSAAAAGTGVTTPRQQVNLITAWLDGSMVYGSDAATAASLRTMTGGTMKTSAGDLLPMSNGFYQAGDIRANENPELTSLHTLFVREHNRLAEKFAQENPNLTDEQLYQKARAWVIAEIQTITYDEWLPALLGSGVGPYRGYDPRANPAISNEFATAGFRVGHSLLGDDIEFLSNEGIPIAEDVPLAEAFFNPSLVAEHGIDSILKYLASDPASEVDMMVVDSVRNLLVTMPGGTATFDLAALNIQRGRDHGLADYNTTRAAYGLPRVTAFDQITSDPEVQAELQALYGTVDNVDLWVGALAEDHVRGGSVGPTMRAIIAEQFARLRAADRFWYQNSFSGAELKQIEQTTLSEVIRRNTDLTTVQPNAFFFRASISGTAFGDANRDGRISRGERGLPGITVQLVDDASGEIVATTTTDAQGRYLFTVDDGVRTGVYRIVQVLPDGALATTPERIVAIRGGETFVKNADLGSASAATSPQLPPQLPPDPFDGPKPPRRLSPR